MKPGDKVKRIAASWGIAEHEGIYTVDYIGGASNNLLHLIGDTERGHSVDSFELVESTEPTFIPEFIN